MLRDAVAEIACSARRINVGLADTYGNLLHIDTSTGFLLRLLDENLDLDGFQEHTMIRENGFTVSDTLILRPLVLQEQDIL